MKGKAVKKRTNRLIPKFAAGIAATLVVMCSFGGFPGRCVEAYEWNETPALPVAEEVIYINDGTGIGLSGGFSVADGGLSGSGISIGKSSYLTQTFKRFDTEIAAGAKFFRHGRAMISFDVKASDTEHALVFAINDEAASSAAVVMNGAGKMYFNMRKAWPTANYLPECARDYIPGRWYNIKILADTENRRLVYFLDNEYWGEYRLESSKALNTKIYPELKIKEIFFNYHPDWKMENGVQTSADGSGEFLIDNICYALPKYEDYDIECSTGVTGNIIQGKTARLTYTLGNDTDREKNVELKTDIISADNRRVASVTKRVSVPPNSEAKAEIEAEVDKYGFYTAYTYLYDNGELKNDCVTRFSSVMKNERLNPQTGFSAHPLTHARGSFKETIDVTKALGSSLLRDDYPMWQMYMEDGVTKKAFYEPFVGYPTMAQESGLQVLPVTGPGPDNMGGVSWPPTYETMQNTNVLEMWGNYLRSLAEMLKGKCDEIEVYNEWPGQAINKTKATPKAYAELLKASAKALREGNPDVRVVAFCCFYSDTEWIDEVLTELGENPGQYFDAVSIHPYMNYWTDLPYPDADYVRGMENACAVLEKHGVGDKPLYATEVGFSTEYTANGEKTIDEKRKSDYSTRILLLGEKYFSKTWLYTITKKLGMTVGYEMGIGHTVACYQNEIPYEAYPAAVSLAAYNSIMGGSTYISGTVNGMSEETEDYDIYINRYKLADGSDCIAMWQIKGDATYSIDFGRDSVRVADSYGNERKLYAADGYVTMRISEEPMYIIAESIGEPSFRCESLIDAAYSTNTIINSDFTVTYENRVSGDISEEICGSDNMTVLSSVKDGDKTRVHVKTGNNRGDFSAYSFRDEKAPETVNIKLKRNGRVIFDENTDVLYDDAAEVKLEIVPYRSGRWQAVCSVKNNNRAAAVSGDVVLYDDSGRVIGTAKNVSLAPGQKKLVRFNLSEESVDGSLALTAETVLDNGAKIKSSTSSDFSAVLRSDAAPKIDGRIDDGEWSVYTSPIMLNTADSAKRFAGWGGPRDLSGEVYLMYDDENFYLAAKVKDNIHFGNDSGGRIWAQDCIQFSFAPENKSTSAITEFAVSLSDGDGQIGEVQVVRYLSAVSDAEDYDINNLGGTQAAAVPGSDGDVTYEVKVPWGEIFPESYKTDGTVCFSLLIADNDGSGRRGWLEFGRGIGDGKDYG